MKEIRKYSLDELMSGSEASERWGYEESFVRQALAKKRDKFLEGSFKKIGKTIIISVEGMEHLTGKTEKEASAGLWQVRHEKNWMVDFERRVDSEEEARNLIALRAAEELGQLDSTFSFEIIDKAKGILRLKSNSVYTYEKLNK